MKRWIALVLLVAVLPLPLTAQQICDRRVNVSVGTGTTALVAAVEGATIQVCGFVLSSLAANSVQFLSGGSAISGVMFMPANGSVIFGGADAIVIQGASGLNLQLSVPTTAVTGVVVYRVN